MRLKHMSVLVLCSILLCQCSARTETGEDLNTPEQAISDVGQTDETAMQTSETAMSTQSLKELYDSDELKQDKNTGDQYKAYEVIKYDDDGNVYSDTQCNMELDAQGNILNQYEYDLTDGNDSLYQTMTNTYDESENLIKCEQVVGDIAQTVEHTYDEHNNRVDTLLDGSLTYKNEYVYDNLGRIVECTSISVTDTQDEVNSITKYTYVNDSDDVQKQEIEYIQSGITETTEYDYQTLETDGYYTQTCTRSDTPDESIVYKYNDNGVLLQLKQGDKYEIINELDEFGNIVNQESYSEYYNSESKRSYTYEYDDFGRFYVCDQYQDGKLLSRTFYLY